MRQLIHISLMVLLAVSSVFAQPTYDMTVDMNYPDRDLKPLTFGQGYTPRLRVFVEQNGATYTNIASDSMTFYYSTNENAAAYVTITNSSVVAASGYFILDFTSANLNTNGSFWYTAILKDSGGGQYYSGDGLLSIRKTTVTGSPGSVDLTTPLDWDPYGFENAGSGPTIGDGATITGTTNSGGQLVLTAVNTGDITSVVAGTGLDGGGTSGDVTLSLNSASTTSLALADSALQDNDTGVTLSGTFTGDGSGLTDVDAATLDGFTAEDLAAGGATYYIWGGFLGPYTNTATTLAQLASPAGETSWTTTVTSASILTNGAQIGHASINTNDLPRILSSSLVQVQLVADVSKPNRTMRPILQVWESDQTTLVTNIVGSTATLPTTKGPTRFDVSVISDVLITDENRFIVMYFELISGWQTLGGNETLNVYSRDGDLTYIELPSVSGIYATKSDLDDYLALDGSTTPTADIGWGGVALTNVGDGTFTNDLTVGQNLVVGTGTATGQYAVAEGRNTEAFGAYSHAEGADSTASGFAAHAEGDDTEATGGGSHAEGDNTVASGTSSHAEGGGTTASGDYSHAAGKDATASNDYSFVWSDDTTFASTVDKSWSIYASGGYRFFGGAQAVFDGELRTGNIADQGAYDLQASDAIITNDITVGGDMNFTMGKGIKWVTDSTNYVYFYGASPTSAVLQYVVDGVTSNTFFNL